MKSSLGVVTIGEMMVMFIAIQAGKLVDVEQFIKRVTGTEFNAATGLAHLGLKIGWVSHVGNDSFGRFIVKSLEKGGTDAQGIIQDGYYATGFQLRPKVENKTDLIVGCFRKGSAASHLSIENCHGACFVNARHLHLSGVAAALSASSYELLAHTARIMRTQGKTISSDPNLRPVLWKNEAEMMEKLSRLAFQADWVLPGLKEDMILAGQQTPEVIADFYLHHGVEAVIVRTGAGGAWYKAASDEQGCVAPVKVNNVVDMVDTSNGFAVGVISTLLEGRSLRQAMTRGNKIGALATQIQDGSEGLSTRE